MKGIYSIGRRAWRFKRRWPFIVTWKMPPSTRVRWLPEQLNTKRKDHRK